MADIAASVLAKLKNKAKASGISYQQCLQLFFQEEFLRRLAGSRYSENFVLKGGLFIYTLTNFESRATVDVDFLMRGLNNDMARMDEDGFVYFCQRIKRMIITSGYNVYPSQLENIIDGHEKVLLSCVIGVKDAYRGQRIRAYIVPAPGAEPDDQLRHGGGIQVSGIMILRNDERRCPFHFSYDKFGTYFFCSNPMDQ